MATVNLYTDQFNEYLKINYTGITACGERCDYLTANLFNGYLTASDCEFLHYLKTNQDSYDDGKDITSNKMMTLALNKFDILSGSSQWKSNSPE